MKLKLILMLPAAISLVFAVTPIIVTADSKPGQMFIAQTVPDATSDVTPDATPETRPISRSVSYGNLKLTDDQKDKLIQIKEQDNQQIQALITPEQETKIQQIQDSESQINAVLTDSQRQELQQIQSSTPRQVQPRNN
jgi:predicted transglutaminase-like cysteine proteinase